MRSLFESGHRPNRPPKSETSRRYEDPRWVQSMTLALDHSYVMAEFLGAGGLTDADLSDLTPRLTDLDQDLAARRPSGQAAFRELPYQIQIVKEIRQAAKPLLEWCWDVVVLGLGDAAPGVKALHQALRPPQHNKFPMARRHHKLGVWVADTIDPDYFWGLLDGLDLRRTCFNVISTAGDTPETLAQFLWVYNLLKNRFGEDKAKERLIITTDQEAGPLKSLAVREHFTSLAVSPNVPGPFAVLSAAGLLPAYLSGIDVDELLAGASYMDQRLQQAAPDHHLAYRLAALFYLCTTIKKRSILVCLPYAGALGGLAEWFCQLWAATLGQATSGTTAVGALGVPGRPSQLPLYLEGPADKLITFLTVDKFQQNLEIPESYPEAVDLGPLGDRSFQELLRRGQQEAAFDLMKAGRSNLTLHLPEINPFTIGQLIYLLEVVTIAAARLFGTKAYAQPEEEEDKQTTSELLDRPGCESCHREFGATPPALDKYRMI
jgi:glucose-6-phosphate isomerase